MQHLKGFGLENFRVFKESTWFDFAPITILVGPNSSGKSSVTKALALLKNTFGKSSTNLDFKTDETILQLGNFSRVLSKNSNSKNIKFSLPFELNNFPTFGKSKVIQIEYEFEKTENSLDGKLVSRSLIFDDKIFIAQSADTFIINASIIRNSLFLNGDVVRIVREFVSNEDGDLVEGTNYMIVDSTIFCEESLDLLSGVGDGLKQLYKNTKSNVNKIYELYSSRKEGMIITVLKEEFQKYSLENDNDTINIMGFALEKAGFSHIESEYIKDFFLGDFSKNPSLEIEYKHNVKIQPKRIYRREEEDSLNQLLTRYASKSSKGEVFLKKWCKEFKLLDELEYVLDIENNIQSIKVGLPLVEQGFGISQIITHLLRLVIFDEGIITFEEPEANLHPAFQSKLADLFADAQKTKNQQFIIETHSEYMIRKFQYLVAKGEMNKKDIVIYYFNDPNNIPAGEKQVKKINILEDGSLSKDFGNGFFDEAGNWELELLRIKRNKTRQN